MANAQNTGSTLSYDTGVNKTSTAVSTNIIIKVNDKAVGAVQKLTINEVRGIQTVDEIGTDGHIDSVPNKSTDISGSCSRIRFDKLRIAEAFSRGFVHVSSQIYPFDITIIDRQAKASGEQIVTTIKNVWIKDINYTYSVSDWIITDEMNWVAETIFSLQGSGPAATGGRIQVTHMTQSYEQDSDMGKGGRRGSLDVAGLIDIGKEGSASWY